MKVPSTLGDIKEHGRNGARADIAEVIVHANVIFNDRVVPSRGGEDNSASRPRKEEGEGEKKKSRAEIRHGG